MWPGSRVVPVKPRSMSRASCVSIIERNVEVTCFELCFRAANVDSPDASLEVGYFASGLREVIHEVGCFVSGSETVILEVSCFASGRETATLEVGCFERT